MKHKKTGMFLFGLGLAVTSQAVLIDDFDGLSLGTINGQSGWVGTAELTTTGSGKVEVDPVDGGSDQVVSIVGPNIGNWGIYKSLGGNAIADGTISTLAFDFMVNSGNNNQNVFFGMSNGGEAAGYDFEAHLSFTNGSLSVRNGGADVPIAGFSRDTWHAFKFVLDTTTDTYDVFMDDLLVGANLVFRNSTGGAQNLDLDAVRLWAPAPNSAGTTCGYVDNINLTFNTGGPEAQIESFSADASVAQIPDPVVLSWSVTGTVSSLVIEPGIGDVTGLTTDGSGSVEVYPLGVQTYTLKLNADFERVVSVVGLPEKQKLHIYLLIGQSNMQGEGRYYNASQDGPHPRVLKFGSRDGMEKIFAEGTHPLTRLTTSTGGDIGMGVEFGKTMLTSQSDPDVMICLINHAMGNSAIQWWAPGVIDNKQVNSATGKNYYLYDEAVQRVHDAEAYGVLKGVLWHQGEYNAGTQTNPDSEPELYAARLQQLVDNLRRDFNNPSLPFVCGKLVPASWVDGGGNTIIYDGVVNRAPVEGAMEDLPNQRTNTFCVDNNGLRGHNDEKVHFDAYSQRLLGQRYAAAMINFYSDPYRLYLSW